MPRVRTFIVLMATVLFCAIPVAAAQPFDFSKPLRIDLSVPKEQKVYKRLHIEERFGIAFRPYASVCPDQGPGTARCGAKVITDDAGVPLAFDIDSKPLGYSPAQLHAAYNLPAMATDIPIIGIVDAYGDPQIYGDLKRYSEKFNLPILPQCKGSIANSPVACFDAVNQKGKHKLQTRSDWAIEISIDVEMAHAICQNCSILLVEANSDGIADMFPAENTAARLGATEISNSWVTGELANESDFDSAYFTHPGVAITAGSGDSGYGVYYPAASPNVAGVGGTSLFLKRDGSYDSEIAWSGAGSGCSSYEARPSWQPQLSGCPDNRTVADVAVDADPNTGVAIYDSNPVNCQGDDKSICWFELGGTSISAPIVAGVYALAGAIGTEEPAGAVLYQNGSKKNLHDIVSGSNGTCEFTYLCNAMVGYDGPTGLGTPKGSGAF
jgi:subtilase family serine protease